MSFEAASDVAGQEISPGILAAEERGVLQEYTGRLKKKGRALLAGIFAATAFACAPEAEASERRSERAETPVVEIDRMTDYYRDAGGAPMKVVRERDPKSGEFVIVLEERNSEEAKAELSTLTPRERQILNWERAFQNSGLVDRSGDVKPGSSTRVEERSFEGFGINVKTRVEVDDQGTPVRLLDILASDYTRSATESPSEAEESQTR